MNENIISVCIPKIDNTYKETYIKDKIKALNIGYIKKYTELTWKNDPNYKRILMRIQWNQKQPHNKVWKERLKEGNPLYLIHNYPHIWNIYLAKN